MIFYILFHTQNAICNLTDTVKDNNVLLKLTHIRHAPNKYDYQFTK